MTSKTRELNDFIKIKCVERLVRGREELAGDKPSDCEPHLKGKVGEGSSGLVLITPGKHCLHKEDCCDEGTELWWEEETVCLHGPGEIEETHNMVEICSNLHVATFLVFFSWFILLIIVAVFFDGREQKLFCRDEAEDVSRSTVTTQEEDSEKVAPTNLASELDDWPWFFLTREGEDLVVDGLQDPEDGKVL